MRLVLVLPLLLPAACAHAPGAPAACAAAVVVDGHVLFGTSVQHRARLPERVGTYPATEPACNDTSPSLGERDQPTTVRRLKGIPPRIAVVDSGHTLYVAQGSLLQLGSHPLHAAVIGSRRTPSYRKGRVCRPYRSPVRGRVVEDGGLRIRTARRTVFVSVDASTRLANRPAYTPVLKGQRVRVATSRCGPRRVADTVRFR